MGDYRLLMQFDIDADRAAVRRWLETTEGIAGWWSDGVEGSAAAVGDRFRVHFPDSPVPFEMEVTASDHDRIEWRVGENPPWWQGTSIGFHLSDGEEGGTRLLFTHSGFEPDNAVIPIITPAWVRFLDNLVRVAETATPNPAVVMPRP